MIQGRFNALHVVCGSLFLVCALANFSFAGILSDGIPAEFTENYRNYSSGVVMVQFDLGALEAREGLSGPRSTRSRIMAAAEQIIPGVSYRFDLGDTLPGLVTLNLPAGMGVQRAIHTLNQSADVITAQPSYKFRLAGTVPDDSTFGAQWQLNQEWVEGGFNVGINAMEAWDIITSTADKDDPDNPASRVMVAVLDTGVDYEHEDLGGAEWFANPDWRGNVYLYKEIYVPADVNLEEDPNNIIDPEEDPNFWYYDHGADCTVEWPTEIDPNDVKMDGDVMDIHGHGTMVAGIIGAIGNNGLGIAGVAWDVNILPVRVAAPEDDTEEVVVTAEAALRGINYAVEMGAKIINMSWTTDEATPLLRSAMAANPDVLFVCAAGDDGNDVDTGGAYPAYYAGELTNVISVMATDDTGARWQDLTTGESSNYGANTITMAAPGYLIPSLLPGDSYGVGSGTSFAAPHVSGAMALAMALNPDWTPDQLRHLLFHWNLAAPITSGTGLCQTDSRLDMYGLLRMLRPGKTAVLFGDAQLDTFDTIAEALAVVEGMGNQTQAMRVMLQSDRWYFEEIESLSGGVLAQICSGDVENEGYEASDQSPYDTFLSGYMAAYDRRDQLGLSDAEFIEYVATNGTDIMPYANLYQLDAGEPVATDPNNNAGVVGLSLVDASNAVYLMDSAALIDNCLIHNVMGNGVWGYGTTSILRDTQIYELTSSAINLMGDSDVEILDCSIYDNVATYYGGGLLLQDSQVMVKDSTFTGNMASYDSGGGIAAYDSQVEIYSSLFSENLALEWDGGAVSLYNSTATIDGSRFMGNEAALDGGAVLLEVDSNATLTNNVFTDNIATYAGGAMAWYDGSTGTVNNNLMIGNHSLGYGGAAIYTSDSTPIVSLCTFTQNECEDANKVGAAILSEGSSEVTLSNSVLAFNENPALAEGNRSASLTVDHCLFYKNVGGDFSSPDTGILFTRESEVAAALGDGVSYGNPLFVPGPMSTEDQLGDAGNFYLGRYDAGQMLDPNDEPVDPNVNASDANSPAIDAGNALATDLGIAAYSTRTDNKIFGVSSEGVLIRDEGLVDLGYHYIDNSEGQTIDLESQVSPNTKAGTLKITTPTGTDTVNAYSHIVLEAFEDNDDFVFESWAIYTGSIDDPTVIEDNPAVIQVTGTVTIVAQYATSLVELRVNVLGGGGEFLQPSSLRTLVPRGSVIDLEVLPTDTRSYVEWNSYTDDPYTIALTNTVTMEAPFTQSRTRPDGSTQEIMQVTARLYEPNIFIVDAGMDIQQAIDLANELDVIKLENNVYSMDYNIQVYKNVRISGESTEKTIITPNIDVYPDLGTNETMTSSARAFNFIGVDPSTVLENLTIRGFSQNMGTSSSGSQSDESWDPFHGNPGSIGQGAGILCTNASPILQNLRFEDCSVSGGTGGAGAAGNQYFPDGGFGGWPGAGRGAAISLIDSNSVIMNCQFYNCSAQGGANGLGGAAAAGGVDGTNGGVYRQTSLQALFDSDAIDYFAATTGVGGAVFANYGSEPKFVDCNFVDCTVVGGYLENVGNNDYRIDTFGGAVYLSAPLYSFTLNHQPVRTGSVSLTRGPAEAVFENCYFENNTAYQEVLAVTQGEGIIQDNAWTGYGGAIAFVKGQDPNFSNCTFTGNVSTVGGAVWARRTGAILQDCTITGNLAYTGGGAYFDSGTPQFVSLLFEDNNARVDMFTDVNSVIAGRIMSTTGKGGALRLQSSDALVQDVEFRNNTANESGGALYIQGNCYPELRNSLFEGNAAGSDGGAISVNSQADVSIRNCTLSDNTVNGTMGEGSGLGGGLYVGEYSHVDLLDSILWGNNGVAGAQLAIGKTTDVLYYPSAVDIDHTLIGPAYNPDDYNSLDELVAAYEATMTSRSSEDETVTTTDVLVGSDEITALFDAGDETVPLIVSLNLSTATDVNWDSEESIAARQAAVADIQDRLSRAIGSTDFEITQTLTNTPIVVGSATSRGLTLLTSSSLVQHIEPVRKAYVAMSQALELGNAAEIRDMYPGDGVSIAIVDSGVDYTHPRLGGGTFPNTKVIGGYDPAMGDDDPMPSLEAHGTCCAGIAAGDLGTIGDYTGGVAYDSKIYALKIGLDNDSSGAVSTAAALEAWDWCLEHRNDDPDNPIKVVSNSWGGAASYISATQADQDYPAYATLARELSNAGILVVAASGNNSDVNSISWPAAMTDVMSVGALNDTTAEVMSYSNTGVLLDIYAPADPVYTTDIVGSLGYSGGDYYSAFNGTSSATPFVAGAVASLQSSVYKRLGRYLTPAEVKAVLIETGDETLDIKAPDIIRPRVNLARAISGFMAWPIAVDEGCQINNWVAPESSWYVDWQSDWEDGHTILAEDPLFVGDYYLTQSSEENMSPAVDAGSADVNDPNVLLGGTTTSIKGHVDRGLVDLGFHHQEGVMVYTINASVVGDANGTLDPQGVIEIVAGEASVVTFKATPDEGYKVKAWTGTDNDNSVATTNKVTLDKDTELYVTVEFEEATQYLLTIEVEGQGTISPASGVYEVYDGTEVALIATPADGYELVSWSGTDSDTSTNEENTVTINGQDATVTVVFAVHEYKTLYVGSDGDYQSIQEALDKASDGDTIIVAQGTYVLGEWNDSASLSILTLGKDITVQSTNPSDPDIVAQTIIDGGMADDTSEWNYQGIVFDSNCTSNTVLNGFTIQNCGGVASHGDDGEIDEDSGVIHPDGYDGISNGGAGIRIMPGASPVIKNCVIQNCRSQAGNGGDGSDATDTYNAGRGGWGGWARGGAVYIGTGASPIFQNCTIQDNVARGGDGGNGGAGSTDGTYGNYGGNYYPSFGEVYDIRPTNISIYNIANGDPNLWEDWEWSSGFSWYYLFEDRQDLTGNETFYYTGPPRWHSGYGGGVFCAEDSVVTFIDCTISGNRTFGGVTGLGGSVDGETMPFGPLYNYEMESYGGGVYCAANSIIQFDGCVFSDNLASIGDDEDAEDNTEATFRFGPYVGHGGGVCAEKSAWIQFSGCHFQDNQADVGGAVSSTRVVGAISDSNMVRNIALEGGGVAVFKGYMDISSTHLVSNLAAADANDPNDDEVAPAGAGLFLSQSSGTVMDCNFTGNLAGGSGGAVSIMGSSDPVLFNNLFHFNGALKNGGALSVSLDARPILQNCTFVSNRAYGYRGEDGNTGLGGAVYVDQGVAMEVYDSVFWQNGALYGNEIALYNGDVADDCPSLDMWYSSLYVEANDVYVDAQCDDLLTLHDDTMCYVTDPAFVTGPQGRYYLSSSSDLVDAGSGFAGELGMVTRTTRTDERLDAGLLDIGYHYPVMQSCRFCDLTSVTFDGVVNFYDFAVIANQWGADYGSNYGDGTERRDNGDISLDGVVNHVDMAMFSDCWLAYDDQAPLPNPPQWASEPSRSGSSVRMTAETATDVWGGAVEYYFNCLTGGGNDSGWQTSASYTDTGLSSSKNYNYRFRVRDEWNNVGQWSETATVYDSSCVAPSGAGWIDVNEVTETTLDVIAGYLDQDSNPSGVQYYIAIYEANDLTVEVNDSNWISVGTRVRPNVLFSDLRPDTEYTIMYKARANCGNMPETDWLAIHTEATLESTDTTPPDPDPMTWTEDIDANDWDGRPHLVRLTSHDSFSYAIEMTATEADDDSGGTVFYQFRVFDNKGNLVETTEWLEETMYRWGYDEETGYGSTAGALTGYRCQVRARDEFWNFTEWSEINEETYVGIVLGLGEYPDDLAEAAN